MYGRCLPRHVPPSRRLRYTEAYSGSYREKISGDSVTVSLVNVNPVEAHDVIVQK